MPGQAKLLLLFFHRFKFYFPLDFFALQRPSTLFIQRSPYAKKYLPSFASRKGHSITCRNVWHENSGRTSSPWRICPVLLDSLKSLARNAFLFQTEGGSRELLRSLLHDHGINVAEHGRITMHEALNHAGKQIVLAVGAAISIGVHSSWWEYQARRGRRERNYERFIRRGRQCTHSSEIKATSWIPAAMNKRGGSVPDPPPFSRCNASRREFHRRESQDPGPYRGNGRGRWDLPYKCHRQY